MGEFEEPVLGHWWLADKPEHLSFGTLTRERRSWRLEVGTDLTGSPATMFVEPTESTNELGYTQDEAATLVRESRRFQDDLDLIRRHGTQAAEG